MRFCGALCGSAQTEKLRVKPGFHVVPFENGALACDAPPGHHEEGGAYCIALGEPRFPVSLQSHGTTPAAQWLGAFRQWGEHAAAHVAGRFSVVAIYPANRTLLLATDKFATWPICHSYAADSFYFASRADELPCEHQEISSQAIFSYLFFHVIPAPLTIFENVQRMQPAEVLKWQDGKLERSCYWRPTFEERLKPDLQKSQQTFRDLIEQAVAREGAGDRIGAFLSGGTDSSTISGMLCKVKNEPAETYSIGFDSAGYDEMEYARIAAKHFGTHHHEYYVTPGDLQEGIQQIAGHYDQPFGNSSAVPALICAERAKADGIEKLLAGDGGDELFGGNTRYRKQQIFDWYWKAPQWARSGILEPCFAGGALNHVPLVRKVASYVQQARTPMPDRLHSYNMLLRLGLNHVFESEFLGSIDQDWPFTLQRETWEQIGSTSLLNQMLVFDWKFTLADCDLPKVIGATQVANIDVGFPFLTDELVEFSLGLPPEWKLKGSTLRWFFKDALRDFLPQAIIYKKKHGFGLPFGVWALDHRGLNKLATNAVIDFGRRQIVRPKFIDDLLQKHLPEHPGYYGELVWVLMMLELWLQQRTAH